MAAALVTEAEVVVNLQEVRIAETVIAIGWVPEAGAVQSMVPEAAAINLQETNMAMIAIAIGELVAIMAVVVIVDILKINI